MMATPNKTIIKSLSTLACAVSGIVSSLALAEKPGIPADGERYFLLGQDRASIEAYMAADTPRPSGLTMYVTLARGENVTVEGANIDYCFKGLEGLKNEDSYQSNTAAECGNDSHRQNYWGSGVQNVQWALDNYQPDIMSIGLWCPQNDRMPSLYNDGAYDDLLTEMADFFKEHNNTKFFLRTCYEFNGDAGGWSDVNFRETFKYVRTFLDGQGVDNVAHVWQSDSYHGTGRGTQAIGDQEEGYWPGKRYVDWVGSSQFHSDVGEEAAIAEAEGLPHFIAEATPHGELFHQYDFSLAFNSTATSPDGSVTLHNDLDWFTEKNAEITRSSTKAWHYINANWNDQPQWANAADQAGQNFFKYTDSRVQISEEILTHFKDLVTQENGFILAGDDMPTSSTSTQSPITPDADPVTPSDSPAVTTEDPTAIVNRAAPEQPAAPQELQCPTSHPLACGGACYTDEDQAKSGGCNV